MPDILIFIAGLVSIVGLTTYVIILRRRMKNVLALYAQVTLDNMSLQNQLINATALYSNDEFVNFLSTSRDSAFQYIEEVQSAIRDFASKADHIVRDTNISPDAVVSFKRLIDMLPKEDNA
jgi:ATP-dependent protease HslVU (ClpYQ) peptidase subunit